MGKRTFPVAYDDIDELRLIRGWFTSRLEIRTRSGHYVARGLNKEEAAQFRDAARQAWLQSVSRRFDTWLARQTDILDAIGAREAHPRYVRHSDCLQYQQRLRQSFAELPEIVPTELSGHPAIRSVLAARKFCRDPERQRSIVNEAFIEVELGRSDELLSSIESRPLTNEQRRAVVTDEDHNLVIASAGSGKTSVIVAKIAHLLSHGHIAPEEILVLAFNRAARDELAARCAARIKGVDPARIRISTFHSMGLDIVSQATSKRPDVAAHTASSAASARHIQSIIDRTKSASRFAQVLVDWFAYYLKPYRSAFDFKTKGDFYAQLEAEQIVTRNGETVRSHEECMIANFLRTKGVSYIYEHPYEVETATAERRQYRPDFFLPDYRIYLEHFGIARDGSTAPYIDSQAYAESMEWKRRLHAEHGTTMVETFSYERFEGNLLSRLEEKLAEHGVQLQEDDAELELGRPGTEAEFSRLSMLLSVFLRHYKSNDLGEAKLREEAKKQPDAARASAFLEIFLPVFASYQQGLAEAGEIDFEGMIQDAARHVESGAWMSPFRYILVDEFQDISTGRARLVRALCDQDGRNQLFAVGDDWQSIYRFAGSNVRVMTKFETFFGATARSALSTTFRCNQQIVAASSRFVAKNPNQIAKDVQAFFERERQAMFVVWDDSGGSGALEDCLRRVAAEDAAASVLVLARFRHLLDVDTRRLTSTYAGLDISYRTIHSAKGLEADYVIVLGMTSGNYGFPSEIDDDPLLLLAQGEEDDYDHAEERRLFYVAMTRARQAVFLVASRSNTSSFVREVAEGGYAVEPIGEPLATEGHCPDCETGLLQARSGESGSFFGCSHYPRCRYTEIACPECEEGRIVRRDDRAVCQSCDAHYEACPSCESGYLLQREGRYGPFVGCSSYPSCRYSTTTIDT